MYLLHFILWVTLTVWSLYDLIKDLTWFNLFFIAICLFWLAYSFSILIFTTKIRFIKELVWKYFFRSDCLKIGDDLVVDLIKGGAFKSLIYDKRTGAVYEDLGLEYLVCLNQISRNTVIVGVELTCIDKRRVVGEATEEDILNFKRCM